MKFIIKSSEVGAAFFEAAILVSLISLGLVVVLPYVSGAIESNFTNINESMDLKPSGTSSNPDHHLHY